MNKFLAATALSFVLASGAAFAQTSGTDGEAGGNPPVIQTPPAGVAPDSTVNPAGTGDAPGAMYAPFFTDDTMAEMRPETENREIFMAMPADQQQSLREQCEVGVAGDPSVKIGEETTGSVDPDTLPPTIMALCQQMSTFQ